MANININNLEVGSVYLINHRVHAGAPKRGQFMELIDPSPGFMNPRAKFTMLDMPVLQPLTRSFQPENWSFTAAPQAAGAKRKSTQRRSTRRRSTRRLVKRRA